MRSRNVRGEVTQCARQVETHALLGFGVVRAGLGQPLQAILLAGLADRLRYAQALAALQLDAAKAVAALADLVERRATAGPALDRVRYRPSGH